MVIKATISVEDVDVFVTMKMAMPKMAMHVSIPSLLYMCPLVLLELSVKANAHGQNLLCVSTMPNPTTGWDCSHDVHKHMVCPGATASQASAPRGQGHTCPGDDSLSCIVAVETMAKRNHTSLMRA